jgi:transcriptional regulator GlxA family with amidase domain
MAGQRDLLVDLFLFKDRYFSRRLRMDRLSPALPAVRSSECLETFVATSDPRIRTVLRDLYQNGPLPTGELRTLLSRKANLCPGRFGVLFKRETGIPLRSFVKRLRLKQAAELLATTPLIVKEVAASVGYAATSNFDRDFATAFNATPSEYRRRAVEAVSQAAQGRGVVALVAAVAV